MGGQIEMARLRYWGSNLGDGLTGMYGDAPFADGSERVMGYAFFAYPKDIAFDRISNFLSPGPPPSQSDTCLHRTTISGYYAFSEMVDVGDAITLTAEDGTRIVMERDPSVHHRPAGESWYVGYSTGLLPVLQGNRYLPDNWRNGETLALAFPGTLVPPDSTLGAIPYPVDWGTFTFPSPVEELALDGIPVRAPHDGYDEDGSWTGQDDDVRYRGPWSGPVAITWSPSARGEAVTLALRYLGRGDEGACASGVDCEEGFSCEEGACRADEGSGLDVVGEFVCTLVDDGEYLLDPADLSELEAHIDPGTIRGAVLAVGRVFEGQLTVPDALTWTGGRVPLSPVRTRALDLLYTRLTLDNGEVSP
jgi:hypothetical protein